MLRIQNRLSFKDPVGRVYTTDQLLLPLRDNAKIYTIADNCRYLFVHISGDDHPTENQIRVMAECSSELMAKNNVLWPEMECYRLDDDTFCGFLARRINISDDVMTISQLLSSNSHDEINISHNLIIGLNLAKCILAVHKTARRYVIGAPHPQDFHVSPDGQVFCCNIYRNDLDIQNITDKRYLAPEYIAMESGLTQLSDSFSFALILFELLTGMFPFGTHDPGLKYDDEQIEDMLLNGESIFYYGNTQRCAEVESQLSGISPALSELFHLTFDYCGCSRYDELRPSILEWIQVLENLADNK